jgi:hypothetical protein
MRALKSERPKDRSVAQLIAHRRPAALAVWPSDYGRPLRSLQDCRTKWLPAHVAAMVIRMRGVRVKKAEASRDSRVSRRLSSARFDPER